MKMADNIESDIDPNIQAPNQQNINPRLGSENSPLKIVSWNICDSTDKVLGDKTNQSDFVSVIDGSDVICLQETKRESVLLTSVITGTGTALDQGVYFSAFIVL